MARLPYVDPAQAAPEIRELFARLPAPLNILRLLAHAEKNFVPLIDLARSILGQQQLDAKLRELAILQVAHLSGAEYEWIQHVPIAKAVGASNEQIAAIERGDLEARCFREEEKLVLRFTSDVVEHVRPSETVFNDLARSLSPREIVELVLAIGMYMMLARLMEIAEVDLDEPVGVKIIEALG